MSAPEERNEKERDERPATYGGYVVRQSYEKHSRRPWQTPVLAALYLLLFLLSIVGLVTLFRGGVFSLSDGSTQSKSTVIVPSANNDRESASENAVAAVEGTLITVELNQTEGGVVRGTGFVVNEGGYAVCHSSLFEAQANSVTVYTGDGGMTGAEVVGSIPSLGVTVLHLETPQSYKAIALGSGDVRRGQTLYGVASVTRGTFYGLTQTGIATSVAETVTVAVNDEDRNVPILYTSIPEDATLNGALVITESGNAAGFLTNTVPGRGGMAAVPVINLMGMVNEIINVN